jgi:hypothetical protein
MTAKAPLGSGKRPFRLVKGVSALADLDTTPVSVTSATVSLDHDSHAGRIVVLNLAAGIAVTLPLATGTGDLYTIIVGTTFTGASSIVCAGTDSMLGTGIIFQDAAATVVGYAATAGDHIIDMLGTGNSTGGIAGERIDLIDYASGLWNVRLVSDGAGTEATPFGT